MSHSSKWTGNLKLTILHLYSEKKFAAESLFSWIGLYNCFIQFNYFHIYYRKLLLKPRYIWRVNLVESSISKFAYSVPKKDCILWEHSGLPVSRNLFSLFLFFLAGEKYRYFNSSFLKISQMVSLVLSKIMVFYPPLEIQMGPSGNPFRTYQLIN